MFMADMVTELYGRVRMSTNRPPPRRPKFSQICQLRFPESGEAGVCGMSHPRARLLPKMCASLALSPA